jgi:hypothetical protein
MNISHVLNSELNFMKPTLWFHRKMSMIFVTGMNVVHDAVEALAPHEEPKDEQPPEERDESGGDGNNGGGNKGDVRSKLARDSHK